MNAKTALITGIGGQDGAYLAQFLLGKEYKVIGTSRDAEIGSFHSLHQLGIRDRVQIVSMAPNDFKSTLTVLANTKPHEIYHLAGQTSVGLSFGQPSETVDSILHGTLNILEAMRFLALQSKFYHASSSECFGDTKGLAADETTPFNPVSPYGVAKSAAHWIVRNYREGHGMFATNGILFNHESALRPSRFVTQKIVSAAHRISKGSKELLSLGNLHVSRDWGWSPEYVDAMWRILQSETPDDFVIATGESQSLQYFCQQTFQYFGLDWADYVRIDSNLKRSNEIPWSQGNATKAYETLGWRADKKIDDIIQLLCAAQISKN